jgi:hypothetical protein
MIDPTQRGNNRENLVHWSTNALVTPAVGRSAIADMSRGGFRNQPSIAASSIRVLNEARWVDEERDGLVTSPPSPKENPLLGERRRAVAREQQPWCGAS